MNSRRSTPRFFSCPRLFESLEQVRKFKTLWDGATTFSSAWPKLLGFLGCETEIKTPKRTIKTARCPEPLKIPHCTTREHLASQNLSRDLSLKDWHYKSASVSERYVFVGICDRGSASAHLRYVNKSYRFRQSLCNFCRNARTVCNKWTLYLTWILYYI